MTTRRDEPEDDGFMFWMICAMAIVAVVLIDEPDKPARVQASGSVRITVGSEP